jgi:hypothetical protein
MIDLFFTLEHDLIKVIIYIIGKTCVLYILVIKSWYLDGVDFLFTPDYTNEINQSLILLGWGIISIFLKFLMILFVFYVYYLHYKMAKFFYFLFIHECKLIFKELQICWYKIKDFFNLK